MKAIFVFFASLILIFAKQQTDPTFEEFMKYVQKYNKVYDSQEEFLKRFEIYKQNKRKTKIIITGSDGKSTAKFKLNKFADLSEEEFRKYYLNLNVNDLEQLNNSPKLKNLKYVKKGEIPKSWNWCEQGAVTAVIDQGRCGSCWAQATAATLESQYLIHKKNITKFSVQQLLDCDKSNFGCNGGLPHKAYEYLKTHKLMLSEDYPYKAKDGKCLYDEKKGVGKVRSYHKVEVRNEEDIKGILYEKGPLVAGLYSFPLMFYSEGVYEPRSRSLCSGTIDHAITIVGYGEEKGIPYWLIKNSWGEDWGEKGYLKLRADKNLCGITTYVYWVEADI